MKIKLVISDLDGTLLKPHQNKIENENGNIHSNSVAKFNVNAINKLIENNILFCVATGRMQSQCSDILSNINHVEKYWITQNGCFIQDKDYSKIYSKTFTKKQAWSIIKYFDDNGFNPFFTDIDSFYMNKMKLSRSSYNYQWRYAKDNEDKIKTNFVNFEKDLISKINISNFGLETAQISLHQMEDLERLLNEDIVDGDVFITSGMSIDIVPKNVSKSQAIKKIAKYLNLHLDEIAFIGDSGNDKSSLQLLKNSFVMSHARENVKICANHIVDSVAEAIDIIVKHNENI